MPLETFLLFVVVAIAPVLSPGPGILFSITTALRYGVAATVLVGFVNAAGMALLGLAVGLGLSAILATSATLFLVLKLFGAAYLIYLGIRLLRDRSSFTVAETAGAPPPLRQLVMQSVMISLTNPKATVLMAALFPPFLDPAAPQLPQVAILAFTYAGLCFVNHVGIAFAGNALRRLLRRPSFATGIRRACAALFIGFGAALAGTSRP